MSKEFAASSFTMGQLNALVKQINKVVGDDEGAMNVLRGHVVLAEAPPAEEFPTWKTITLGTGPRTSDEFKEALEERGVAIDGLVELMEHPDFEVASQETTVELVKIRLSEIGLEGCMGYGQDLALWAKKYGLELCPAEVGPQIWLQNDDSDNEKFRAIVAMEPMTFKDTLGAFPGSTNVFYVGHLNTEGRELFAGAIEHNVAREGEKEYIFVRRSS